MENENPGGAFEFEDVTAQDFDFSIGGEDEIKKEEVKEETPEEKEKEKTKEPEKKEEVKEEVKEEKVEEVKELSVPDEVADKIGWKPEGELDDSVDGIVGYTIAFADKRVEDEFGAFYEVFPEIAEYVEFVENGGNKAEFWKQQNPETDYKSIEIEEDNKVLQKRILNTLFKTQGLDEETIAEKVKKYEEKEILFDESKGAVKQLAKIQEAQKKELLETQAKAAKEREDKRVEYIATINKTIKEAKEIKGLPISETDKKLLADYMLKPVTKDGTTQDYEDAKKSTLDEKMLMSLIRFKKYNVANLIKTIAKTEETKKLRDRVEGAKKPLSQKGEGGGKGSPGAAFED